MAATHGAEQRIMYLLGKSGYRSSPSPLTAAVGLTKIRIFSYALEIAEYDKATNTLTVYDQRSSLTTNRHIRAARLVANSL